MHHAYLLEIGTEELPPAFMDSAPRELAQQVETLLNEQAIAFERVRTTVTPRRLILAIEGLADEQGRREEAVKGPPTRIAFDDTGRPTRAAEAFAARVGVTLNELERQVFDGEECLATTVFKGGRPSAEILAEELPAQVLGLSGPRFMRWGDGDTRFARPIRWVVSLLDDAVLPLAIGPVHADRVSYGNRMFCEGPLTIASATAYWHTLAEQGRVLADASQRRERIAEQLVEAARAQGGVLPAGPDYDALLDTVTTLVEWPGVMVGRFDEAFLAIPKPVITTVMASHQKYFPVETPQGDLLPCFLAVSNGQAHAAATIVAGNERVLRARLQDARFFFDDDCQRPLEDRLEALKGVTFQKGMGTLFDKTQRLEVLALAIAEELGYEAAPKALVRRAALLSKTDLVTAMVFEFTELQGEMGARYARLQGEDPLVADALAEQYLPRFHGDAVAVSPMGVPLSVADKIDTMTAVFSREKVKMPSGSRDPLGLRRMANGLILTLLYNGHAIDLLGCVERAFGLLTRQLPQENAGLTETLNRFEQFLMQRLRGILQERGYRHDLIEAVVASAPPLRNLPRALEKLDRLTRLLHDEAALMALFEPANRISRILAAAQPPCDPITLDQVNPKLFAHVEESALYEMARQITAEDEAHGGDDEAFALSLRALAPAVERYFEKVLVHDPDEAIRANRLTLLSVLNRDYLRLAAFSKLVMTPEAAPAVEGLRVASS